MLKVNQRDVLLGRPVKLIRAEKGEKLNLVKVLGVSKCYLCDFTSLTDVEPFCYLQI
jgi:hypothetical protein